MEEFKGVKLSDKYDFDPDKIKYAYEPPKQELAKAGQKECQITITRLLTRMQTMLITLMMNMKQMTMTRKK